MNSFLRRPLRYFLPRIQQQQQRYFLTPPVVEKKNMKQLQEVQQELDELRRRVKRLESATDEMDLISSVAFLSLFALSVYTLIKACDAEQKASSSRCHCCRK